MEKSFFTTAFAFLLFAFMTLSMSSCGGDDESCTGVTKIDGTISINGQSNDLTIAQLLINAAGGGFNDVYAFQVGGVNDDCSEVTSLFLNIELAPGATLGGSYSIVDFFSSDANTAYGSVTEQKLDPISQNLKDLVSGQVTIVNNGNDNYELDVDAQLAGGGTIKIAFTHTF